TAAPEAITPSTIKKAPKARYQPHFRSISASPVLKRFLAASKKPALLIQNSFPSSGCFQKPLRTQKTTLINLDATHRPESMRVPRKMTCSIGQWERKYHVRLVKAAKAATHRGGCICRHGA